MDYKTLTVELNEGIAIVKLNRPESLNVLNQEAMNELSDVFTWVNDSDEVKVSILTGEGKAFVAGGDITLMHGLTALEARNWTLTGQKILSMIEQVDKMVICAINGYALGGGCELAMACDIRIASERAKFSLPELNLGIIPGFGGTQRLPRLVGKGMAKYLITTSEMISADEAYRIGLVEKVVPADELIDAAVKVAKTIMTKAPIAVMMAKQSINNGLDMALTNGIAFEGEAAITAFASDDRREGMSAFVEKRPPVFKNR